MRSRYVFGNELLMRSLFTRKCACWYTVSRALKCPEGVTRDIWGPLSGDLIAQSLIRLFILYDLQELCGL